MGSSELVIIGRRPSKDFRMVLRGVVGREVGRPVAVRRSISARRSASDFVVLGAGVVEGAEELESIPAKRSSRTSAVLDIVGSVSTRCYGGFLYI